MATTTRTTRSLLTALTYLLPYKTRGLARAAVALSSVAQPTQHRSFRLTMPRHSTTAAKAAAAPLRQSTPYPIDQPADAKLVQRLKARVAELERDAEARRHTAASTTPATVPTTRADNPIADAPAGDAVLALQALGFPKQQAKRAVAAARAGNPAADTAVLVKLALANIKNL